MQQYGRKNIESYQKQTIEVDCSKQVKESKNGLTTIHRVSSQNVIEREPYSFCENDGKNDDLEENLLAENVSILEQLYLFSARL